MKIRVLSIEFAGEDGFFDVCLLIDSAVSCFRVSLSVSEIEGQVLFVTTGDASFYKAIQGGLNIAKEIYRLVRMKYTGDYLVLPFEIDMDPIGPLPNYPSA